MRKLILQISYIKIINTYSNIAFFVIKNSQRFPISNNNPLSNIELFQFKKFNIKKKYIYINRKDIFFLYLYIYIYFLYINSNYKI